MVLPSSNLLMAFRLLGGGASPEVIPIGRDRKHTAETIVAKLLDVSAKRAQHPRQWFPSCHHFQQIHLGREQRLRLLQVIDINLEGYVADDISVGIADQERTAPASTCTFRSDKACASSSSYSSPVASSAGRAFWTLS